MAPSRTVIMLLAVALLGSLASLVDAADTCTAECACYCDPGYGGCTIFCKEDWNATCTDGFCDGPRAECCCSIFVSFMPPRWGRECWGDDCGTAPPVECAKRQEGPIFRKDLPSPGMVQASAPEEHSCRALLAPGPEPRWYFLEYSVEIPGKVQDLKVHFASASDYAEVVKSCMDRGQLLSHNPNQGPFPRTEYYFGFTAPSDYEPARGRRRIHLSLPDLGPLDGDLALQVEMTKQGELLGKELLFSTDEELGELVLEHLEAGLRVESPGDGPGPFTDVFKLKIQDGKVAVFGQGHYTPKRGPVL